MATPDDNFLGFNNAFALHTVVVSAWFELGLLVSIAIATTDLQVIYNEKNQIKGLTGNSHFDLAE